jgi:DNA-binding IclR family transcriptional regulator
MNDWWSDLNDDVLDCLATHGMSAAELGSALGISEDGAVSLIAMLAREGKVRLTRVELSS